MRFTLAYLIVLFLGLAGLAVVLGAVQLALDGRDLPPFLAGVGGSCFGSLCGLLVGVKAGSRNGRED